MTKKVHSEILVDKDRNFKIYLKKSI